jgi:predicted permease
MLTESFVVAALGAIAGVLMAFWGRYARATKTLSPPPAYWVVFKIDAPVLVFTVLIVLVATLVSGLVPALVSSRTNAAAMMKEGGRGNSSRLVNVITRVLVVGQIALTAALLIAASLQVKSIRNQVTLNYGYDENGVYCARMGLMEGDYPTPKARVEFFKRALRSLHANPAFESAAMSDRFRMTFANFGKYEVDGQNYVTERDRPQGNSEAVSDNYFTTLGLKMLEGRDFTIDDNDEKRPVAIVNASFARKYFGRESAIGRRVRIFDPAQPHPWRTIVGVVPDTLMQGPFNTQTDNSGFMFHFRSTPHHYNSSRSLFDPHPGQRAETLATPLGKASSGTDSNLPTYFGGTPGRLHAEVLGGNRIIATLFAIFGVVAFVLSAVGLYGVMSFSVNQRTQEFGIRMALGADAARIFRMVMSQGAWQLAIGLLLGGGAAALLLGVVGAGALANILFKVNALDPTIYFAVAGLLTLVAAASCFVPARRATRVNPMVALRTE